MSLHAPPNRPLDRPSARIRMDARLDADTRHKVDDLAGHFRLTRASVLRHVMQWGLDCGAVATRDQGRAQGPAHHLYIYVDADLYEAGQKAATAAGVHLAPWLRQMVRHVTIIDFPASWQEARSEARSHDSRIYGKRFMLRLDDPTWATLEALSMHFERSAAEIIRQLLAQASLDAFPASWHLRVAENHRGQAPTGAARRQL